MNGNYIYIQKFQHSTLSFAPDSQSFLIRFIINYLFHE